MIEIRGLKKSYQSKAGSVAAVANLDMDIAEHEFFTLLGPSGCGKTSLLRCIAGLENPDEGEIRIDGVLVFSSLRKINMPPNRRNLGMVFQSYAIWPHMTVFQNVQFPLAARGVKDGGDRVRASLEMVGLAEFAERSATRLSGGQQQRVALARAIASSPSVLLLDEPLSNLDADLRQRMCAELRQLQRTINVTTIYVTHDQSEALSLSSRIAVLKSGYCIEVDSPAVLYSRPRMSFTARFIGNSNVLSGVASGNRVETPIGSLLFEGEPKDGPVEVFIRPEALFRVTQADGSTSHISGKVKNVLFGGVSTDLEVIVHGKMEEGIPLRVKLFERQGLSEGEDIRLAISSNDVIVLDKST